MTIETKTLADELREAAARLRGESADTTPGPWRRHDTHLNLGGHTATVLAGDAMRDTKLVAWLPSWEDEPWADHPCWANSRWIALVHPGLAEPLAAWLDEAAREADMNEHRAPRHRYDTTHAHAVARAINGSTA